jgi:hypothetical protein
VVWHGEELELKPIKSWAIVADGKILVIESCLAIYQGRKGAQDTKSRLRRDLAIKNTKIVRITIYFCDLEKPF